MKVYFPHKRNKKPCGKVNIMDIVKVVGDNPNTEIVFSHNDDNVVISKLHELVELNESFNSNVFYFIP